MLRIEFTPEDLVRVRISESLDPMWEIIGSVQLLQLGRSKLPPIYQPWAERSQKRLVDPAVRGAAGALATVAPYSDYFPDFLTPDRHTRGFDDDLDAVLSTPVPRLRKEIDELNPSVGWLHRMADGDPKTLNRFGEVVRRYHESVLAPDQGVINAVLAAHRSSLLRTLMQGGTEAMLAELGPSIRWRAPYLETRYPVDRTVKLNGRGLLLVPSYFCWRMPITLADPSLTPVLVYPVEHPATEVGGKGLSELVGNTRAAVLHAAVDGASTTDVAKRVGISLATASHHTTVLRDAGLLTSSREANRMVHSPSPLGAALLANG